MTISRVVNGIDIMIKNKQQLKEEFLKLQKSWGNTDDLPNSFANSLVNLLDLDIDVLTKFQAHLNKIQRRQNRKRHEHNGN
jgi:hypothetical protein